MASGKRDGYSDRNQDSADRGEDTVAQYAGPVPGWLGGDGTAGVSISAKVYSRNVVLAAAYKLSDRCAVLVDTDGDDRWVLYLIGQIDDDPRPLIQALANELGDQALRERLESEFGALRTLIVAQAFSEGNLLDPDEDASRHGVDPRRIGPSR